MSLDRRTLLRLAGLAGASLLLPGRRARASTPYQGPFWVFVNASGGWDPTMVCDPKGRVSEKDPNPVNHYFVDEIETVGPFQVPPTVGALPFFQRVRDQLLVLNGLDTQTVSHVTGERHVFSGSTDTGFPSLAALIAATVPERPSLAFLSNGGYDETSGLVAATRLDDVDAVAELAYPDRLDAGDPASTLWPTAGVERLAAARAARVDRLRAATSLPRVARALEVLAASRSGENELAALTAYLPDALDNGNPLFEQAQVAMACFRAGVSVSANLSLGGFDTHGDHDNQQGSALEELFAGLQFILDEAERQQIADQLIVVVGSDFARTPYYNDSQGKDHWSVTSCLLFGPGIRGGRVVGATDAGQVALNVNPSTLGLDAAGVRLTPAHLHASLRQLAGISNDPLVVPWQVGDLLPLLG